MPVNANNKSCNSTGIVDNELEKLKWSTVMAMMVVTIAEHMESPFDKPEDQ